MNEGNSWTSAHTACSWNSAFHFSCEQIHRAERFSWNNSWVTNRKQLVQLICRKIQGSCQRKSCWKQCFHPSQRIVSQAKFSFYCYPSSYQTQLQLYQHRCPDQKGFLKTEYQKAELQSISGLKNKAVSVQISESAGRHKIPSEYKASCCFTWLTDNLFAETGSSDTSGPTIKINHSIVR